MTSKIQNAPPPPPPSPRVWTSLELVQWTAEYFKKKGIETPRLEAELLLAEVLKCPRIQLYVDFEKPVQPEKLAQYREYVKRRAETREPHQYILGHAAFIDLQLIVSRAVLIPRPETEQLAQWALERLGESPAPALRVLDLCTGSGCIAVYLAAKQARATVVALDISAEALAVAPENARAQQVDARVIVRESDLFAGLLPDEKESFDLLVCNPPYVDPAERATLQPEVRDHEPALALFADENGLAVLRRIIGGAAEWLKPGAWLGIEFGHGQADALRQLAEATGAFVDVEIREDLQHIPRLLLARRKGTFGNT